MQHKPLNLKQAAEWLHISENRAQELAAAGILPGAKHGREWTFLEADLVRYHRDQVRRQQLERQGAKADQSDAPEEKPKAEPARPRTPSRGRSARRTPPALEALEAQAGA